MVDQPGQETSGNRKLPDRCLLLSDSRIGEEYQELVPIWDNGIVRIGRDPQSSLFIKNDLGNVVSRDHCEVYVVVYDEAVSHVYVRDRKSSNGTFVNNIRIGTESEVSPGYLLEDGDAIEIHPHWTFTFCDNRSPTLHPLTPIQEAEIIKLFEDKYQIGPRCLGQGADGVVYLATEIETKKQLVCKVVDLKKIRGRNAPEELRRKLQEADVLRQLQHPNILPYVDAIASPHSLFTLTELATGGDLWSFLYQRDVVGELETRVIIRQVLHALDYIHTKGVVHRDLKPENILLAFSPSITCHRVMLSDFGACAVPRRSRMLTHTGTVHYQAPEIQGQPQLQTAAVDVWSLGIVALTLLTHHMDVVE
ncbi:kinase [Hirsutella rhossiliensis]|uniref:Kinase n=1 Tax=Hirsutella rhossiliensis TaxID=111463 RepID=A0A9P8SDZ8_9HYPO|nr:kinase [Hirsutella rhossiliensis]KAH0959146.1 kinase [Hirsutella rhossiliensis]